MLCASAHNNDATDFVLDRITWLPRKTTGASLADPGHPVPAEMLYEDWRTIAGVRFARRRTDYHSRVKRGEETTKAITVNSGLGAQRLAAIPADAAPADLPAARATP
jgi:hypothetical protein